MGAFKQMIFAVTITAWVMATEVSADISELRGNEKYNKPKRNLSTTERESKADKGKEKSKSGSKSSGSKESQKDDKSK